MELALRRPSGAYNFEVVPRPLGQFMDPFLWTSCKKGRLDVCTESRQADWLLSRSLLLYTGCYHLPPR